MAQPPAVSRDPRIDAYIAKAQPFARPILTHIRERLHAAIPDLEESIKWGMPFFSHGGRPLANMAAFKAHASFGFWNRRELATGQEGEAMGQFGRLARIEDLPPDDELDAIIRAQVELAQAPDRPKRPQRVAKPEAEVPPALATALSANPAADAIFRDFAPSHRREYCEWIAEAKRDATRAARVAQAIEWIAEGRQRNWKYQVRNLPSRSDVPPLNSS